MVEKIQYVSLGGRDASMMDKPAVVEEAAPYVVAMWPGIGDTVIVGLTAIESILRHAPEAKGNIDVLCNEVQVEIFSADPRVRNIYINSEERYGSVTRQTGIVERARYKLQKLSIAQSFRRKGKIMLPPTPSLRFDYRLGAYLPSNSVLAQRWRNFKNGEGDASIPSVVEASISKQLRTSNATVSMSPDLYLRPHHLECADRGVHDIKKQSGISEERAQIVAVATDTSSAFTRPSADLLYRSLVGVLENTDNTIVYLLPSYSSDSSRFLFKALQAEDERCRGRVQMMTKDQGTSLLQTVALLDHMDVLVTGDTGILHLAHTHKVVHPENTGAIPNNNLAIVALYGGTSPTVYGYPDITILGKGRHEQRMFSPGLDKGRISPEEGVDYFDHISPDEVTSAVLSNLNSR